MVDLSDVVEALEDIKGIGEYTKDLHDVVTAVENLRDIMGVAEFSKDLHDVVLAIESLEIEVRMTNRLLAASLGIELTD